MKTILKLVTLFTVCFAGANAPGMTFNDAMSGGHISCSGSASSSYTEATLTITNRRSYSVTVDFSTAWFVQSNASQRIGLAYEKSTGGYNLTFAATRTYTLRFSSRCLDHSRSAPTTGGTFASYTGFSSQFSSIVSALRGNYSQASVWSITDNSTAWLQSDPRYVAPTPPPAAQRIDLTGSWSSRISGSSLIITAGRVDNNGSTTSGTLRLRIFASRTRYTGSALSGYVMGTTSLGQFPARTYMSNISRTVSFTRPPSGTYWTVIVLEEYTSSGWLVRDYGNSSSTFSL